MSTAIERIRPQEQALAQVAAELGILQKSTDGAMLINLGEPRLKDKYNVLAPATTLAKADPNFTPALHVLSLDPGDFYGVDFEGSGQNRRAKTFALSKVQLDQIAKVAGIEDLPPNIVYFGSEGQNLRVTWSARMRRPDGTWQIATGSREWIEADEKERLLASPPEWVTKAGPANNTNSAFNDWWAKNWFDRVKKHRLGMTETKARLRAYRSLLTVKAKYTKEEIAKPFIIASTMFTPDTSDLRVLGMLMGQGQQATNLLYGPTGTADIDDTGEHVVGELLDEETGELLPAGDPETVEASEVKTHGERPADDREIPRGPYAGQMLSNVCRDDATYARGKFLHTDSLGPLTAAWLVYWHGQEGDDFGDVTF